jgi:hypothetical protein
MVVSPTRGLDTKTDRLTDGELQNDLFLGQNQTNGVKVDRHGIFVFFCWKRWGEGDVFLNLICRTSFNLDTCINFRQKCVKLVQTLSYRRTDGDTRSKGALEEEPDLRLEYRFTGKTCRTGTLNHVPTTAGHDSARLLFLL